jgi:sodium/potassium/calcium exchanger 4
MSEAENISIEENPFLTEKEKAERRDTNCTPPAIEQFPEPLMHNTVRKHGGVILHIIVALYMFVGLAIVCDDYFVPALDRLTEGTANFNFRP